MLRWQYYVTAVSCCPLVSHHPDGLFCSPTWPLVLCSCCLVSSFTWIFFSDSYPFECSWCHIWTCALGLLTLPMPTYLSESFRKTEPLWRLWNKALDYRHKDLTGQSSGNECPKRECIKDKALTSFPEAQGGQVGAYMGLWEAKQVQPLGWDCRMLVKSTAGCCLCIW